MEKMLTIEVLRKARKENFWLTVAGCYVGGCMILVCATMSDGWVFVLGLLIIVLLFWKKTKAFITYILDNLGLSTRKRMNKFYLIKSICTEKEIRDCDGTDLTYLHFGKYCVFSDEVSGLCYYESVVGEEFWLQFYEGDDHPRMVYLCREWRLSEDVLAFIRD